MHVRCSVFCRLLSAALLLAASPFAQSQTTASVVSSAAATPTPARQSLPYTLHQVTTTVQTLADGTQITHRSQLIRARDSEGRTRSEIYPSDPSEAIGQDPSQPISITIFDPTTRQAIQLDPRNKIAMVRTMPEPQTGPVRVALPPQPNPERPKYVRTVESLGNQTINGVDAVGERITTVYPAGAVGNNRDFTVVQETWIARDLGLAVRSKTDDPRIGSRTLEVTDLDRNEPDPSLFQIPSDYTVRTVQNPQ